MPATLEPPPLRTPRPPAPKTTPLSRRRQPWNERLIRSGYFLGAVLVHLLVFLMVATWVVFKAPAPPPSEESGLHPLPAARKAPPLSPPHSPTSVFVAPPRPDDLSGPRIIIMPGKVSSFPVHLPGIHTNIPSTPFTLDGEISARAPAATGLAARLPGILSAVERGQERTPENIRESPGDVTVYKGRFKVYLASYADGDWNCNVVMKDGAIIAGSLPNLVAKIREWSHTNMDCHVVPTPLNIGGPDLMDKSPPFIFFTGHKDFVLTDGEIANLRAYLQNGGAIWGDNALPGYGSRFDVAFHREMKRVIPDKDKQFEDVPLTHEIFRKSWFNLNDLAQGMNYYAEPIQHLDLDHRVAILYTPNDYSDLFSMDILPGDAAMAPTWVSPGGSPLFTNGTFLWNSGLFFRNYTLASSLQTQRLGMNIVAFLLVRFDHDLILMP